MSLSRRKFLKLLGAAVGGSVVGYGSIFYLQNRFPGRIWVLNGWIVSPPLEEAPLGALAEPVMQTLITAVHILIDLPVEEAHYLDFFRWHAQTLPGYKGLYESFATTLNRSTRQIAGCNFNECEPALQRQVLQKAFEVRQITGRFRRVRSGLLDRDWLRFDTYIVREIFALYSRTDALVALGYEAWPGKARGLDHYTQTPSPL